MQLALTLAREKMHDIAKTVRRTRDSFDGGEDAWGSFTIEHDPWCPALRYVTKTDACACGIESAREALINSSMDAQDVMDTLKRCIEAVAGDVNRTLEEASPAIRSSGHAAGGAPATLAAQQTAADPAGSGASPGAAGGETEGK